jgi:tRNA(Ile)-lysidine synthase
MMQARFDTCLDGLLPDGGAVLLAVSGGIDSMVMADLASKSVKGHKFAVAHCNFHLRGDESDGDEAFVREWAAKKGITYYKKDFDTNEYASAHGLSIEMAARELRYGWFASICEEDGLNAVAVAHNANDNAETLFLNLLRGTGLKGICGMKEVSPLLGSSTVSLIRPLLVFSRDEIKEYALTNGLEWREDSTNADSAYKRNLIRNEVFPLFEKINPSFLETITADMSRFDQAGRITDDFVASYAPKVARREGSGLVIDPVRLSETPNWEYLLYRLIEPYGFNESVIRDIALLVKDGSTFSGRRFLSKEYIAETSRDSITISIARLGHEAQGDKGDTLASITIECQGPGEYSLEGVRFIVEQVQVEDPRQPEGVTVADLAFPFTVRRWQAGDWMRPLGMKGCRKKLSDMFVDLKFSPEQKEKALVIADEGSHVLALIGYRVDESVKVKPKGPVIRIRLI